MSQLPDQRRQILEQASPQTRPFVEAMLDRQQAFNQSISKRDGIAWRLDQIPERAKQREGEERERLLARATVLEAELREAIERTESLRLQLIPIEIELRIRQLRDTLGEEASALIDEYEREVTAIGVPSRMNPQRLARSIMEGKRLYREMVLSGTTEPGPHLIAADEEVKEEIAAFEEEQRLRYEVSQRYEPRLRRLLDAKTERPRKR